jgi:hypothetical protein
VLTSFPNRATDVFVVEEVEYNFIFTGPCSRRLVEEIVGLNKARMFQRQPSPRVLYCRVSCKDIATITTFASFWCHLSKCFDIVNTYLNLFDLVEHTYKPPRLRRLSSERILTSIGE